MYDLYLDLCIRDSIDRGEAPFASHKMYPGPLDDKIAEDRKAGMEAGYAWWEFAKLIAFYCDFGMSPGMEEAWEKLNHDNPYQLYLGVKRYLWR
jgi:hypothetical protein